jgi:hypothetical protein
MTSGAGHPLGLRGGLRRLSTGLLAYGAIGLIVALLGLVALIWVSGRIGALADRAALQVDAVIATLDDTSTALTDAGTTAGSFSSTLSVTASTVGQAAEAVRAVQPRLADLEAQFRSINILGNQPLAGAADMVAGISAGITGLDVRLDQIGASLADNEDALAQNQRSLTALGVRVGALADRLRTGGIDEGLDDVQAIVTITMLVFAAWTAVPAVGALILGTWLRRELGRTSDDGSAQLVA